MKKRLFHKRPICMMVLGLMTGILIAEGLFCLVSRSLWLIIALIPLLLTAQAYRIGRRFLSLFLLLLSLGLLRAVLYFPAPIPEGSYLLSGRVADAPAVLDYGTRLTLNELRLNHVSINGKAELWLKEGSPVPDYGTELILLADCAPIAREHSYQRYKGIRLRAEANEDYLPLNKEDDAYGALLRLRENLTKRVVELFPNDAGLAAAMLLGNTRLMESDAREELYAAGIGHLAAVSGLHVGVLAGAVSLLVPRGWRLLRLLLVTGFVTFYALITALSPSVLRAGSLILLLELSFYLERRFDLPTALSLSALVILFINPAALFFSGFQLSFLAMYGLMTLYPLLRPRLHFLPEAGAKITAGSAAVTLSTLPASALLFERFTPFSLLTNLLALPLAPIYLIPAGLALLVSYLYLPLANLIALVPRAVLLTLNAIAKAFSGLALSAPKPGLSAYLLFLIALAVFSPFCLLDARQRRACGWVLIVVAGLCWLG